MTAATDPVTGSITTHAERPQHADHRRSTARSPTWSSDHGVPDHAAERVHEHGDGHRRSEGDRQHAHERARRSSRRSAATSPAADARGTATRWRRSHLRRTSTSATRCRRCRPGSMIVALYDRVLLDLDRAEAAIADRRHLRRARGAHARAGDHRRALHVARREAVARRREPARASTARRRPSSSTRTSARTPRRCARAASCSCRCATRGGRPRASSSPTRSARRMTRLLAATRSTGSSADLAATEAALAAGTPPDRAARPARSPAEPLPAASSPTGARRSCSRRPAASKPGADEEPRAASADSAPAACRRAGASRPAPHRPPRRRRGLTATCGA